MYFVPGAFAHCYSLEMISTIGAELVKMLGDKNCKVCQVRDMAGIHVALTRNALSNSGVRIGRKSELYMDSVLGGCNAYANHWVRFVASQMRTVKTTRGVQWSLVLEPFSYAGLPFLLQQSQYKSELIHLMSQMNNLKITVRVYPRTEWSSRTSRVKLS